MYVKDIQSGICAKDGEPVVEKESAATALVDGKNLLGPVVGNFCMNLAIQKAKEAGIGWVVAHGEARFFPVISLNKTIKCIAVAIQMLIMCMPLFFLRFQPLRYCWTLRIAGSEGKHDCEWKVYLPGSSF